jgi:hypothetical protein
MTAVRFNSSKVFRGLRGGTDSQLSITENPTGGSVANTTPTIKDMVVARSVYTSATNNFAIRSVSPLGGSASFVSSTPSICSVDVAGNVSASANGSCLIDVLHAPSRRTVSRTMALSGSVTTDTWSSYISGSLANHIDLGVRAMISGKSSGAATQAVLTSSAGQASSPAYVRNSGLFTGALSLAAISVYTTAMDSNIFPVVLISPWHIIAGHVGCSPGQQIVFKRDDGGYEVRTVVSQLHLAAANSDNYVGILNSPISTITPMPFLPSNWLTYIPCLEASAGLGYQRGVHLPVLNKGYTAGDWIRILQCYSVTSNDAYMSLTMHSVSPFASWSSNIIGGDSNGPVFVPVNGVAALCHCMNFTNGGGFYPAQLPDIQAKMNTLGAAQTLTTVNLSGFPTY